MKNLIVGGLAVVGAALAIASAVPAHATTSSDPGSGPYGGGYEGDHDAYAYWNQLDQYGSGVTVTIAQNFATRVCEALSNGVSEGQIVNIAENSNIPGSVARLAVHGAEYHFCPTYF
jgi:hypothetical protein